MAAHSISRNRRSIRLPEYDYCRKGGYFVTMCAYNRESLFGEIRGHRVALSDLGRMVEDEWRLSQTIRREVHLDAYVVMPNHLHAIVFLTGRYHSSVVPSRGTPGRSVDPLAV